VSYVRTTSCHGRAARDVRCAREVDQARSTYRSFHASPAAELVTLQWRRSMPQVLVHLGTLRGLIYSSDRGDGGPRTYIHFMEDEPVLACDSKGTQLYIVGGRYRVTRRGIEG
jgi:hypothetical protein